VGWSLDDNTDDRLLLQRDLPQKDPGNVGRDSKAAMPISEIVCQVQAFLGKLLAV
jgi:hypothetical protein